MCAWEGHWQPQGRIPCGGRADHAEEVGVPNPSVINLQMSKTASTAFRWTAFGDLQRLELHTRWCVLQQELTTLALQVRHYMSVRRCILASSLAEECEWPMLSLAFLFAKADSNSSRESEPTPIRADSLLPSVTVPLSRGAIIDSH